MVPTGALDCWNKCSEGLVGGWPSPDDAEGNKHQGEEAEKNQANDERKPDELVTGTRETWPKGPCGEQLSSL